VYEISDASNSRLRLRLTTVQLEAMGLSSIQDNMRSDHRSPDYTQIKILANVITTEETKELIIPLLSDTAFFQLLSKGLQSLSEQVVAIHSEFVATLGHLSRTVSNSARPVSFTSTFHPHSLSSNPAALNNISSSFFTARDKSDLYSWRELFKIYLEAEVFESINEIHREEWPVAHSETRLQAFLDRVTEAGLANRLKLNQSRTALETFLRLNVFILNIKKFRFANTEATRKILKKHTKRTFLPFPQADNDKLAELAIPHTLNSLPRVLVQAIGETLLSIIPQVDDYTCLICMCIAFKPIRLVCRHFFCVRCLVKMQKRGQGCCPMCRAPTVLMADRSNVDWALLNFMQDWFPVETKAKLKSNEREAAAEELLELGISPRGCIII